MKTGAALVLLALAFGAGWVVNGWRLGERAAEVQADHEAAASAAWRENARELSRLQELADDLQARVNATTAQARKDLEIANAETNALRDCLRRGTCGLRVNTAPTACPPAVPGAPDRGPVDPGAGTVLTPDAESAYFTLREGLTRTEAKLRACQGVVGARVAP